MNGADVIVKCLESEGVSSIFGYPGVAICPFYDSILDSDIESILVRTEQNAAHAASGYSRVTGKIGVCAVTSGPGATNLITGVATAFADSIPMICITGQVHSEHIGSDVFQEADITGAVESFVKYSYLIKDVNDIPRIFKEAFHIAGTGRKGPVLIDIPIDVQRANVKNFAYPAEINIRTYKPTVTGHKVQIKKVISELKKARRPIICVGGGVLHNKANLIVREFVKKHRIPVVSTMMGLGAMQSEDPLYFGMVGNNGKPYANKAMNESDMIIMVGARVADRAVNQPDIITENKILVHIDVDPAEIGKNVGPSIPLVGECENIFQEFLNEECLCKYDEWIDTLTSYRETMDIKRSPNKDFVDPCEFIKILSRKMDRDGIYVADVGQNQIWSCLNHMVYDGNFLTSGGMGTMGYSIPAAMGAKKGCRNRQTIAVCGDGSFQMSMMEFATINQSDMPIKVIVLANNYLGMVREFQHNAYKGRYSLVDMKDSLNYEYFAKAYGLDYIEIENMDNIESKIEKFLKADGTGLMVCRIDPMDKTR